MVYKKIKRHTFNLVFPAGVTDVKILRDQTDPEYDRCIGYAVYENSNPGVEYQISVYDDNKPYQNYTNSRDYIVGTNVDKRGRYTEANFKAGANYISVGIKFLNTTTNPTDIDFVFLLEKTEESCEAKPSVPSTGSIQ